MSDKLKEFTEKMLETHPPRIVRCEQDLQKLKAEYPANLSAIDPDTRFLILEDIAEFHMPTKTPKSAD